MNGLSALGGIRAKDTVRHWGAFHSPATSGTVVDEKAMGIPGSRQVTINPPLSISRLHRAGGST